MASPSTDSSLYRPQLTQQQEQQQQSAHARLRQRFPLQVNTSNPSTFSGHSNPPSSAELQHHTPDAIHEEHPTVHSPATSVSATSPGPPNRTTSLAAAVRTRSATIAHTSSASSSFNPLALAPSEDMLSSSAVAQVSPSSAAHTSPSTTSTAANPSKRKRSRVTPEQLAYLERIFATDRSPGAARRKEISDLLGMQERQTQIWFQNRRAKAKMLESRGRGSGAARGTSIGSPMSPPELGMASDADLQAMIHAGEPITIIQCTDLTIGTWHRIAAKTGMHDLIAYTAEGSQTLTWYIFSENFGFRMDIPYSTIERADISTTGIGSNSALATLTLTQSPSFWMEAVTTDQGRIWKKCTDWTEGMQASTMLRHEVIGSAPQLYQALSRFPGRRSAAPSPPPGSIVLHAPHAYAPEHQYGVAAAYGDLTSSGSPLHHHSPAVMEAHLAGSPGTGPGSPSHYAYPPEPQGHLHIQPPLPMHGRQRSYSGPAAYNNDLYGVVESPTGYSPASPFSPYMGAESPSLDYALPPYPAPTSGYGAYTSIAPTTGTPPMSAATTTTSHHHHHSDSLSDFAPVPISQMTRPFSSHGVPQSQLSGSTSMYMPQQGDMMSAHMSAGPATPIAGVGYGSFGEGAEVLHHQQPLGVAEHLTRTPPPRLPPHRTSSTEPISSLSGALGPAPDYPSNRSPHSAGGSDYHYSN